jgi:hypothetical protein
MIFFSLPVKTDNVSFSTRFGLMVELSFAEVWISAGEE